MLDVQSGMIEFSLGCTSAFWLFGMVIIVAKRIQGTSCRINASAPTKLLMVGSAMIWGLFLVGKCAFADLLPPGVDAVLHENIGREIALALLDDPFYGTAVHFGIGNGTFRFLIGLCLSYFWMTTFVVIALGSMLSFCGSLSLIEVMSSISRRRPLPDIAVLLILIAPSVLFWSTELLKEGFGYWGGCCFVKLCHTMGRFPTVGRVTSNNTLWIGACVNVLLRPHHGLAWLGGLCFTMLFSKGRVTYAMMLLAAGIAATAALASLRPELWAKLQSTSISEAFNEDYEGKSQIGGSAINHGPVGPIPLVSGMVLLLVRPFPWEVSSAQSLIAGVEIWLWFAIFSYGLCRSFMRGDVKASCCHHTVLMCVITFLLYALLFSFMYNMGLLVRQRVQVYPAMFIIAGALFFGVSQKGAVHVKDCRPHFAQLRRKLVVK